METIIERANRLAEEVDKLALTVEHYAYQEWARVWNQMSRTQQLNASQVLTCGKHVVKIERVKQ